MFIRKLFCRIYCSATRDPALFSSFDSPHGKSPDIVDYLIKAVGLSPEAAIKSSKSLSCHKSFSRLKSLSGPDAVLRFFKENGFSDAHIKSIVSKQSSLLLTVKVNTTLKSKIIAMKELGFSESEMHRLVSTNPIFLSLCIHSKIQFWRSFLGSKEKLFNALIHNNRLICHNLDKIIMPKFSFLHSIGFSNHQIASMISRSPTFISRRLDSIKSFSKKAEEMGFSRGSWSFPIMLTILCHINAETLNSKLKLLRSFGWSEAETSLAIRKDPGLLATSEKKLKAMMEFLVHQVGFVPSFFSKQPRFLMFSLERRMVPRNHILQLLATKGLLKKERCLPSSFAISEKKFMEKYVFPYQEKMPELHQVYLDHCIGDKTHV